MYSPVPMYILNAIAAAYNALVHRLDLTVPRDEVTYMLLGRSISAALGTATIPLVYHVARHVSGRLAGVFAAFLLAFSVIHLRESHFFSLDVSMTFFTVVAWCFLRAHRRARRCRRGRGLRARPRTRRRVEVFGGVHRADDRDRRTAVAVRPARR